MQWLCRAATSVCVLREKTLLGNKTKTIRSKFLRETSSMKVTRFKKLLIALSATCLIATTDVSAQTTSTTSPTANQTIEVTSQKTTWIQVLQANGIDIPAGADGVVISNGAGGNITASLDAIVTQSDTSIVNAGNIAGGFNAINFVNGSGSGSVTQFPFPTLGKSLVPAISVTELFTQTLLPIIFLWKIPAQLMPVQAIRALASRWKSVVEQRK